MSTFALSLACGLFLLAPSRFLKGWRVTFGSQVATSVLGHSLRDVSRILLDFLSSVAPRLQTPPPERLCFCCWEVQA